MALETKMLDLTPVDLTAAVRCFEEEGKAVALLVRDVDPNVFASAMIDGMIGGGNKLDIILDGVRYEIGARKGAPVQLTVDNGDLLDLKPGVAVLIGMSLIEAARVAAKE
jgi:hypothetical protein